MKQQTATALLVMDMQLPIVGMLPEEEKPTILSKVGQAITHARKKGLPIIYVIVGFRPGMPEISATNKAFSGLKDRVAHGDLDTWMTIHPDLAPQKNDIIVIKRRVSAFTGSDLEVVLRGQQVQHLILTGIATSGVVLSTLREASDKDYQLSVLSDACADGDPEVHRVLVEKVFPRQADVLSVAEWIK